MPTNPFQAATVRTVLATAAVAGTLHVTHFDPALCGIQVDDDQKLAGTFADIGIQDLQMPAFRQILAGLCPEVRDVILDPTVFPLAAGLKISMVIQIVGAALAASANFQGDCVPAAVQQA